MITISADTLEYKNPLGIVERIRWDDICTIAIETTDEGPFVEDVFFVLESEIQRVVIPQSAVGIDSVQEQFSRFPGLDYDPMIKAMSSCDNARFVCWQRG